VALGKGLYCSRACRFGTGEDRFWNFVERSPDPDSCWRWTGTKVSRAQEYGRFTWDGRPRLAHHVSWLIHYGPIPDGQVVRHRCPGGGNPWCVNPDHLAVGTYQDNMRDMFEQGRHWSQTGAWSPKQRARPDGLTGDMREIVVIVPRTLQRRLQALAKERGCSLQELAYGALADI
jgi:hypothetical protein